MIPANLRITLIIGMIIYFLIILSLLKRKSLSLKYTLLWLLAGVFMLLAAIFPRAFFTVTHLLGIVDNMNGLFIVGLAFVIIILMAMTSIVSKQSNKIKVLTQELAILEKRIRELEQEK